MSGSAGPAGPARSGGWVIGPADADGVRTVERMERTPWDEIEELKHELRVARFNEETQRQRADVLAANFERWRREDRTKMERVAALVDVRRKMLRMDDLRRALGLLD